MKYTDLDMVTCSVTHTLIEPPKVIGYWVMPGSTESISTKFGSRKKPNWFHRTMMFLVLGFKWEDAK